MTLEEFTNTLTGTEALRYVGYGHRKVAKRYTNQYAHEVYHLETNEVVGHMDAHEASAFAIAKFKEMQEEEKTDVQNTHTRNS